MPSSTRQVIRGSRRRFTAFWLFAFVSKQMSPSTTANHIATRCGWPSGPTVAIVMLRLPARSVSSSSSVSTICARWLTPTCGSALAGAQQATQSFAGGDALLDEFEHDLLGGTDAVHPAHDLSDREPCQLTVVCARDAARHLAVQDSLQRHGQRLRRVLALPGIGPSGAKLPRRLSGHRPRAHGAAGVCGEDVLLRFGGGVCLGDGEP